MNAPTVTDDLASRLAAAEARVEALEAALAGVLPWAQGCRTKSHKVGGRGREKFAAIERARAALAGGGE